MAYTLHSLVHILEHILLPQNHRQHSLILDEKPVLESLLEKVNSLKQLLERCPPSLSKELQGVESKIRDASHKAEDIIESRTAGLTSTISSQELQKVIHELHSAKEMVLKIVDVDADLDGSRIQEAEPNPSALSASRPNLRDKDLVGLDADLLHLKDRLTADQPKLDVIPIVGMGGLGKTTLAQNLFDDQLIVTHFRTRAWVTVSQDYNFKAVLLGLLGWVVGTEKFPKMSNPQLGEMLYRSLYSRRYLIVFDDMWSTNVWDDIKQFLPDNNNRSRIMVTTRELDVANCADPTEQYHQMHLLEKRESWELLRKKLFMQEHCPPSLEKIGEKIVDNCGGLPLAISVIAGLLSTAKLDQSFWNEVAYNTSSIVADKDQFSNIFSLSYDHLPSHLKPCFLYFGVFPEDSDIRSSKLIRLWMAEGFLKPIRGKSLEEAAEVYLKSLLDRNLISVRKRESKQKAKSYGIHDLLRDLCLKKAIQEKFFVLTDGKTQQLAKDTSFIRRVSVHQSYRIPDIYALEELMSFSRSFLCTGPASRAILSPIFFSLRLLRVLDVLEVEFHKFPEEILQLVNLGYLALGCLSRWYPNIQQLINLQTLIVSSPLAFQTAQPPREFWKLGQLRHVKFKRNIQIVWDVESNVNKNIQTLSNVCRVEFSTWQGLPNLRELGILCHRSSDIVTDLRRQEKLETLKCTTHFPNSEFDSFSELALPPSLKKLSLVKCPISPRLMSRIGSLPNLQVLKLKDCIFQDMPASGEAEWEVADGEFSKLQLLELKKLNLVHWTVNDSFERPFSTLERLVIRECTALKSIPPGIGDINTLEMIELHNASLGAVASANMILDEQREYGNDVLQVREYGASS